MTFPTAVMEELLNWSVTGKSYIWSICCIINLGYSYNVDEVFFPSHRCMRGSASHEPWAEAWLYLALWPDTFLHCMGSYCICHCRRDGTRQTVTEDQNSQGVVCYVRSACDSKLLSQTVKC